MQLESNTILQVFHQTHAKNMSMSGQYNEYDTSEREKVFLKEKNFSVSPTKVTQSHTDELNRAQVMK